MKKKSRDFRRNRRKKWVIINFRKAMVSMIAMESSAQAQRIICTVGLSVVERALMVASLALETQDRMAKALTMDVPFFKAINT